MTTLTAPAPSLGDQFQPILSEDAPRLINILVYGQSGLGKTLTGATGPAPVLFLDLDDGLASVRSVRPELAQELGIDTAQVYTQRIRNYADLKRTLVTLGRLRDKLAFPKTLVFDNLTVAQHICMQERTSGDESVSVDKLPERADWNVLLQRMRAIVRFVRDLPCNTYFIAMEEEREGAVGPALQGAMRREIPALLDVMARYVLLSKEVDDGKGGKVVEERRYLQCLPSAGIPGQRLEVRGKDRFGRLARFEVPNLNALIAKVYPAVGT